MALTKPMDFGNGVVTKAAYIIVSSISIDYESKNVNFVVKTFLNKETYDKGLTTIINQEHFNVGNGRPGMPINQVLPVEVKDLFTEFFLVGEARENASKYLLTLPNFKDCSTVL